MSGPRAAAAGAVVDEGDVADDRALRADPPDPFRSRVRSFGHLVRTLYLRPDATTSVVGLDEGGRCGADHGEVFRLLSYNVNFGLHGRSAAGDAIVRAVRESGAAVVALQETQQTFEERFRAELAELYPHQHWRTRPAAGGSAVLSRFPLDAVEPRYHEGVDGSWFETLFCLLRVPLAGAAGDENEDAGAGAGAAAGAAAAAAAAAGGGGDTTGTGSDTDDDGSDGDDAVATARRAQGVGYLSLLVANVHLRPPVDEGGTADLGTLSRTNAVRLEEMKCIAAHAREAYGVGTTDGPALVVVGDFNEPENMPASRWGKASLPGGPHVDAVEQWVDSSIETHRWPFGPLTLKQRLDHVLYPSNRLRALDCCVVPGYATNASDHQPILAAFALAE